jgi:hypothetical protein
VREARAVSAPTTGGPNVRALRRVIDLLTSADFDLGCAAREAKIGGATTVSASADKLMRECIALREGIRVQIGDPPK